MIDKETFMKTFFDIPYLNNASDMQLLDIYLPDGDNFDTIIWFHGGGIEAGSRKDDAFARSVTQKGYAFVSAEYRLYPDARFPEFIQDAAAAVAWTIGNIANYGGSGKVYVSGESAGAYLTMMLCMDQHYLSDVGISQEQISGYISDSAQQFNHYNVLRELGIDSRLERMDAHAPIFFIHQDLKIQPLLLLYYENDIKCRPEETRLMYASLQKVMPDAIVHISELPGSHCCKGKNENGEYHFLTRMFTFIESLQ